MSSKEGRLTVEQDGSTVTLTFELANQRDAVLFADNVNRQLRDEGRIAIKFNDAKPVESMYQ